jgi:hypothetical protein
MDDERRVTSHESRATSDKRRTCRDCVDFVPDREHHPRGPGRCVRVRPARRQPYPEVGGCQGACRHFTPLAEVIARLGLESEP